jgi:hypothetical protein
MPSRGCYSVIVILCAVNFCCLKSFWHRCYRRLLLAKGTESENDSASCISSSSSANESGKRSILSVDWKAKHFECQRSILSVDYRVRPVVSAAYVRPAPSAPPPRPACTGSESESREKGAGSAAPEERDGGPCTRPAGPTAYWAGLPDGALIRPRSTHVMDTFD